MAPVSKPKPVLGPHFLREWRDFRDIRQQVAADAINVSRELLSKIENQKSQYSQPQLERLAALYRASPAQLITEDPTNPPPPIADESEIRRFVERIDGFTENDVMVVMVTIMNAINAKRAGSGPSDNRGQPLPASPRHELEPSGSKSRPPSS